MLDTAVPRRLGRWILGALLIAGLWWLYGLKSGHYEDSQESKLAAFLSFLQLGFALFLVLTLRWLLFLAKRVAQRRRDGRHEQGPQGSGPG
ncbi:MAG: hypothetical protein EDX89_21390 [Acidobacteria bacterium]|nr:MAG: hypothetical protein EDX89_21390 [Acidobacteriota bacterium]MCE7956430.1 hypothetical protein [Acidobacteria bacterium ACB2]